MNEVAVNVILENNAIIPKYHSENAAGADICASLLDPLKIFPGESALIPTGIFIEIPEGFEIQLRPRSGLAFKNQITVLNSPGTIDSDYRGEIKVILINHGKKTFVVEDKMRIAQIILSPVMKASFIKATELASTERGSGGFGHTGF